MKTKHYLILIIFLSLVSFYPSYSRAGIVEDVESGIGNFFHNFFNGDESNQQNQSNYTGPLQSGNIQPENGNKFSFAVLGDTKSFKNSKNDDLNKTVEKLSKENVSFVMTIGDLVSKCDKKSECLAQFNKWKKAMQPILGKTYEVVGNHDRSGGASDEAWQQTFNLPENGPDGYKELAYSFDYANSHFVVLDSEKPKEHEIGQDQIDWLNNDLNNNSKENTFIFFHEPAFPMSEKWQSSLDVNPQLRDRLWSVIDSHNVKTVFVGHEHVYSEVKIDSKIFPQAKNSVYQINSGNTDANERQAPSSGGKADYYYDGRGYLIVSVDGGKVTVDLFGVNGGKIHELAF